MKQYFLLLISLLITLFTVSACSGGSGGSDSGSDDPSVTGPNTPTATEPPPLGGGDDLDPTEPYDFGGHYAGDCVVKAMGVSSQSCKASMNIYHQLDGLTIGFMGTIDINMGFTQVNYPVSAKPHDIAGEDIVDPETGEVIGEINYQGFIIEQGEDFMVFNKRAEGGFNFVGQYQDATYGQVNVEGSLDPKE